MGTLQYRRGPAATWTSDNPTLSLGEPGVETDNTGTDTPLAYKIGDGTTPWRSLPYFVGSGGGLGSVTDGTNTVSDPTELLFPGATVSNPSAGIAEVRITASSGGSGLPPAITPLGNQTGTATLPSPNNGDLLTLTMTGDLTLTLPAAPPSGETLEFDVIAYQGPSAPTDGYTLTLVSSVGYPSGTPVLIATAGSANWIHCKWSPSSPTDTFGTEWSAFPVTSGPTVVACEALRVIAGDSNMGGTGGRWMGVCSGEPTQTSPQSGDWWMDITTPAVWTWNGSAWVNASGGGSFSGVVVSSPGPYQRPSYDTATSTWLAANPEYVDVAAHYNVRTGSSDVSSALATGIQDIVAAGLKPFLAPGMVSGTPTPYKLANPLVLGNGSSSALSTWTAALEGVSVPTVTGVTSFYALPQTLATRFIWTASSGYSGAMVQILGPVASVWLKNLLFDANGNTPLLGIETISVRNSHFENLAFLNAKGGAVHTTVGASVGSTNTNDSRNTWKRISYGVLGHGSTLSAGIQFTNGSLGTGGDSCYEEYDGVWVETSASGPPTGNMGIWFQACDSIRMRNVNIAAGGWQGATLWDYSASGGAHPADCIIDLVEMGGQQFGALQLSSPAGAGVARNRITKISACNGQPPNPILQTGQPSGYGPVTNTTWGSDNLTGQVQMASGSGTVSRSMISWLNSGIGGTSYSDLPVQMRFSLPGAPGTGGAGQLYVSSVSGTTATIQSTNSSDNSLYNWELLSP